MVRDWAPPLTAANKGNIMSKHRKSPRAKPPGVTPASDKSPGGKKRNGHDKRELKETTAAEAVVSPKKAEPAPAPVAAKPAPKERASEAIAARKKAEAAVPAVKPTAKAPARPAEQPAANAAVKPSAVAQAASSRPVHAFAGTADTIERSFEEARQGTIAVNRKLIDFARENLNSSLEHARDLAAARSPVSVMRLQMEFWHECLELFASQAQELRAMSAELVERANEPIRKHMRSLHGA
jgi:hypothetical protein